MTTFPQALPLYESMENKVIMIDGNAYLTFEVIMLPTEGKAPITKNNVQNGLFLNPLQLLATHRMGDCTNQHIYILSDEEINEGDWCLHSLDKKPIKCEDIQSVDEMTRYGYKKIIATTDSSLTYLTDDFRMRGKVSKSLPQPKKDFLEKYIIEYNRGNRINRVFGECDQYDKTKIDLVDNTVNLLFFSLWFD